MSDSKIPNLVVLWWANSPAVESEGGRQGSPVDDIRNKVPFFKYIMLLSLFPLYSVGQYFIIISNFQYIQND